MPDYLMFEPAEAVLCSLGDALGATDVGILLLDQDLRIRFVNRRMVNMLSVPPKIWASCRPYRDLLDHVGTTEWLAAGPDERPRLLDHHEAAVRKGPIPPVRITMQDGRRLLFSCCACPDGGRILTCTDISRELQRAVNKALEAGRADLRFQNETLESQAAHLASLAEAADESTRAAEAARLELEQRIAEQRQLEAELRRLATVDGLTGALNRAAFMTMSQQLLEQSRSLTTMMLDVDHFKSINDRYGHAAGDYALQRLAAMLQEEIRDHDLLGRLGGEEFAVVLQVRALDEAMTVAERLRIRVAQTPLMAGGKPFAMTISVGVAVSQPSDFKIDQVIARADEALYQAKTTGRNRVIVAETAAAA